MRLAGVVPESLAFNGAHDLKVHGKLVNAARFR
jgi:hypothetical protein